MEKQQESNFTCNIAIGGSRHVGKTSFVSCVIYEMPGINPSPLAYSYTKKMIVEGKTVDVHLYDLVGAEIPKKPPPNYHLYLTRLEINGVILLYDITQKDTFQMIPEWIKSIRQSNSKVVIMLIGSKCDVDEKREVSFEEGVEFSKSENLIFYEASSIKEINVREAFAFWSRK